MNKGSREVRSYRSLNEWLIENEDAEQLCSVTATELGKAEEEPWFYQSVIFFGLVLFFMVISFLGYGVIVASNGSYSLFSPVFWILAFMGNFGLGYLLMPKLYGFLMDISSYDYNFYIVPPLLVIAEVMPERSFIVEIKIDQIVDVRIREEEGHIHLLELDTDGARYDLCRSYSQDGLVHLKRIHQIIKDLT